MKLLPIVLLVLGAHATGPAVAGARTTVVDPSRGEVTFSVTKYGFERVNGRFNRFTAAVVYDRDAPERSSVRWRVEVRSVETGEPGRDRTLQTAPSFDAARYPEMTFESHRVRPLDGGRLEVAGAITIRGTTRPLTIVARLLPSGGFETAFTLDRYDFGVSGSGLIRRVISRTVKVRLMAAA